MPHAQGPGVPSSPELLDLPGAHLPSRCEASRMGFVLGCYSSLQPTSGSSFRIVQLLEPYLLFTYIWEPGHTAPLGIRNSEAHMQQMPFQVVTGRSELQGPQAARNPLGFLGLCQMNMPNKASLKKDHFTEGNSEESHLQQGTSMVCQSIGCHSGLSVCFI